MLISTCHHGSKIEQDKGMRDKSRNLVDLPIVIKDYSVKKVEVNVGDQQLCKKISYTRNICNKDWYMKWRIHIIQQCRHNTHLCWRERETWF